MAKAEEGGRWRPGPALSPDVPMVLQALMPVLLWVGVLCVCFRQLHQTSSLAVGVMEESYRESLE